MRRRVEPPDALPADLREFDVERWAKAACGDTFTQHIPAEHRAHSWYVQHVAAPLAYRAAVAKVIGHAAACRRRPLFTLSQTCPCPECAK